ncbi:hypothetical protein [uncultured Aquimarina sp.]|uniref:hypothetical protein n=1 Tax=uncultured Aquimarina sp. TaxID=575652 RepID=UPI002608DE7F|nr:hypothetical protein [uncultured Aquimarina sp.]
MKNIFLTILFLSFVNIITADSIIANRAIDTTTVLSDTETYSVYHDNTHVYLTINTIDPKIATSILRQGVTIYFDVKGRKKKNVSITYPIIRNQRPTKRNEDESRELRRPKEDSSLMRQIDHRLQNDPPQKALYTYYDNIKEFNTFLNNDGISINIELDKEKNSLLYSLKIPKLKITNDANINLNKLTIGVKTVEILKNKSEGARSSNQQQSGRGTGRGGPPRGSGGQGRSGNGLSGDHGRSKGGKQSPVELLDFWFKAKLK